MTELNRFAVLNNNPIDEKDLIFVIEFIIEKVIFNFGSFPDFMFNFYKKSKSLYFNLLK